MRFLDLFSGIGGFRLGMEQAGHECVGHVEWDKFARISYKAIHRPKEDEFDREDITKISDEEWQTLRGKVDCICAGFPCQTFSIAGRRRGFEDTQGTMFFEVARAAKQTQPRYLLLENVKGLLSHEGGERSLLSSPRWMNSGTMRSGRCLTLKISESHRIVKGCSLLDILEEKVDEKYFLSTQTCARLLKSKNLQQIPLHQGMGAQCPSERMLLKVNRRQ